MRSHSRCCCGEDPADKSIKDQLFDDQLIALTREDNFVRNVLERLNASGHSEYSAAEGRLYHEGKIYVPEALRDVIIERHHDSPLAGHFGAEKTQALTQVLLAEACQGRWRTRRFMFCVCNDQS